MGKIRVFFEWIIITVYTFYTLKIVYPFLIYKEPKEGLIMNDATAIFFSKNLLVFVIGIFLNIAIIIYFKILSTKAEVVALIIYSILNIKLLSIFLLNLNQISAASIWWGRTQLNYYALFVGLFLNTTIIFYWLRKNTR